jgi:uracil-DNA glycosylase
MVTIHPSREKALSSQREQPYFTVIKDTLKTKIQAWEIIYPPADLIFSAFNHTPLNEVKVVVLWQDPYHGAWQAHWLSFSVPDGIRQPPSLKNIYKEIVAEYGWVTPVSGNLEHRANQWVLLLNSFLTVTASQAGSHQWIGRDTFTDRVIQVVSEQSEHVVFLLWWKFAESKEWLIDAERHCILKSSHPSPFSAYRWFLGNGHFKATNEYLELHQKQPIERL